MWKNADALIYDLAISFNLNVLQKKKVSKHIITGVNCFQSSGSQKLARDTEGGGGGGPAGVRQDVPIYYRGFKGHRITIIWLMLFFLYFFLVPADVSDVLERERECKRLGITDFFFFFFIININITWFFL